MKLPRFWSSLRARTFFVVLAVLVIPLALVVISTWYEAGVSARLRRNALLAARRSLYAVSHDLPLDAVAQRHHARIRVFDRARTHYQDFDRDDSAHAPDMLETRLFIPAPTLLEFDATLEPIAQREEVIEATAHPERAVAGCRSATRGRLLVCSAAMVSGDILLYVQSAQRRPASVQYDLRYKLARLTLMLLPVALALGWWLGRRTVLPLEMLQRQVLDKAARATANPDLALGRGDEIDGLASAFNALLSALEARRAQNEAFVADLVHEFKNPVAAIRASAEALESGASDPARAARIARALRESSGRLDALVSQFLELARAEGGLTHEARTKVDVRAIAQGVVDAARSDVRNESITLTLEAPEPAWVSGVSMRLESALRNLVDNATSFTGEGGVVSVSLAVNETKVTLRVTDTGPGLSAEDLPRVFARFFTKRGQGRDSHRGTGLGLALVRAVIEAHGGTASVESPPGGGATFVITLPALSPIP